MFLSFSLHPLIYYILISLDLFSDLDMAIAYWNLVLSGRFKFLELWNKFLLVSIADLHKVSHVINIYIVVLILCILET